MILVFRFGAAEAGVGRPTQFISFIQYNYIIFRYGEGTPPIGWPEEVEWANFKGASNSRNLKNVDLVEIITSMLIHAGFDPQTHTELEEINNDLIN